METKYATYKLNPKGARMKTGITLSTLDLPIINLCIPEEKKHRDAIKIIPNRKEKTSTIELF